MHSINDDIRAIADNIGFSLIGFADISPFKEKMTYFNEWLDFGYHAEMKYMANNAELREDPSRFLEGAKTDIVCAVNYYQDYYENWGKEFKIGRYALGEDYHKVIEKMMKKFCATLKEKYGANSRYSIDSSPLMEKALAERAGIGWQGKNSLIISEEFGSFIFLAIAIVDIEIEPDRPIEEKCGSCDRCIKACPTGAIARHKMIDCNKCISYWTIESKSTAPEDISAANPNWIFGCDECQNACPYNAQLTKTTISEFTPTPELENLSAEAIMNLDETEFKQLFSKSPIKRAKIDGIKRNLASLLLTRT